MAWLFFSGIIRGMNIVSEYANNPYYHSSAVSNGQVDSVSGKACEVGFLDAVMVAPLFDDTPFLGIIADIYSAGVITEDDANTLIDTFNDDMRTFFRDSRSQVILNSVASLSGNLTSGVSSFIIQLALEDLPFAEEFDHWAAKLEPYIRAAQAADDTER